MSLLACPFDGGAAVLSGSNHDERFGYNRVSKVHCTTCSAQVTVKSHEDKNGWNNEASSDTDARAAEKWNTRYSTT